MKKVLFIMFNLLTITTMAQTKGNFEVHDFDTFKLHVYYTNDALGDASYIIEGKDALVTMEQPLFKDNVAEFDAYLDRLGKPVEQRITNYHVGGTGHHDVVMAEGMPAFTKGDIYSGMMQGFAQAFGDAMTDLPTGKATEVAFGTTHTWAGVPTSPLPASSSAAKSITRTGLRQKPTLATCKLLLPPPLTQKSPKPNAPSLPTQPSSSAGTAVQPGAMPLNSKSLT